MLCGTQFLHCHFAYHEMIRYVMYFHNEDLSIISSLVDAVEGWHIYYPFVDVIFSSKPTDGNEVIIWKIEREQIILFFNQKQ